MLFVPFLLLSHLLGLLSAAPSRNAFGEPRGVAFACAVGEPVDASDSGRTRVWSSSGGKVAEIAGFRVWQWCPAWNGLLVCRLGKAYRWGLNDRTPKELLDVERILPNVLESMPAVLECCVDVSGQFIAVRDGNSVAVINLQTKACVRYISWERIKRAIGKEYGANIWCGGITMSAEGWIAVSAPTKRWPGSTDGTGPAQCVVVSPSGTIKSLGLGTPVAWIDNNTILCRQEDSQSEKERPVLLSVQHKKPKTVRCWGYQVGWDGHAVLVAERSKLTLLNRKLERTGNIGIPTISDYDDRGPLVGVPYAAVVGHELNRASSAPRELRNPKWSSARGSLKPYPGG